MFSPAGSLPRRSLTDPPSFAELMMRTWFTRTAVALVFGSLIPLAGCQNEGPAERAGKSIDNAARDARDAIAPGGPMEKAGRDIDRALNKE